MATIIPTYPGVYVQEVPSGVRTIAGVSTSIAMFLGRARQGPLFQPVRCLSYGDFDRAFTSDGTLSDMARHVRLFFMNGGSDCYVMRIANGASAAEVTLNAEDDDGTGNRPALRLVAKQAGVLGETIRAVVSYGGRQPEATFNLELFRWATNSAGRRAKADVEVFRNLSMDPDSPLYAADFITQESKLVDAEDVADPALGPDAGISMSGRPVAHSGGAATMQAAWEALLGSTAATNRFQISVDGLRYVPVDLAGINVGGLDDANGAAFETALTAAIQQAIVDAYAAANIPGVAVAVTLEAGPVPPGAPTASHLLRFASTGTGDVTIRPSASGADLAAPLMLGVEQGGLEIGAHARRRPAPSGTSIRTGSASTYLTLIGRPKSQLTHVRLDALQPDGTTAPVDIETPVLGTGGHPSYVDTLSATLTGNSDGLRQKLGQIRDAVNLHRQENPRSFYWEAELAGPRLTLRRVDGDDNATGTFATLPNAQNLAAVAGAVTVNARHYSVGAGGTSGLQTPTAAPASDGDPPTAADYEAAFPIIDREVDLFNLMVLPTDAEPIADMRTVWGPASAFCQQRRAVLLMDAPASFTTAQIASTQVATLRQGLVNDHAILYYPRLTIVEDGRQRQVGATGAVAGVIARVDGSRGVWKAAAGMEATIRGIIGLEHRFSDGENGILNPRGINTIRVFPNGITVWGARTMDGDNDFASQWTYAPVRRTALFIEESLYRGMKWAVFEPNAEPLWAQIRLNVGAFMHNLFRQGAFKGTTPRDAYFVKCDAETTTQNDINLGIVNVQIGFAPLKPAEFVFLFLQQMAGQVEA